ncbi:MAG: TonB-dependent receptor [Bryobacterales bacterium]|nr:TonB-dependent receptor [Bryobacterales bacterium]
MKPITLALLTVALAFSQSDRGTVTGRVTDPTDAAVANATVTIRNIDTGIRSTTKTSDTGNYVVGQLLSGNYEVDVESPGFRRHVRKDVVVSVAQTVTLNVALEVGQVEQSVEVSASAALLEASTSDLGTAVTRDRIVDLPLAVSGNMRHPGAFVFLAPGVTGDTSNTQINGSQNRAKEVLLDGIGSVSPESGGLLFTYPSVEAINEFKLVAANFSAEYGRTGGGFEVYTTKSGANDFHGGVFEYFRNDKFDARGFFARTRPINRQNEYGVALGGPILIPKIYNGKNRTFFHFVWSGFRFRQGALNELLTLPTEAMRRGDFNGSGRTVYDPATTRLEGGRFVRDPYPGNVIPTQRFSRVSRNVLPLIPAVSNQGLTLNYQAVGASAFDRDQYNVKVDHNFSDTQRLNVYFYWNEQTNTDPTRLEGPLSPGRATDRPGRWVRLNHDSVIGATKVNNLRAGFTREPERWARFNADQNWPTQIGLSGVNTGAGNAFPRVQFTDGLFNWSDETKNVGQQANNAYQLADTFSMIRGNHSLKFGTDLRWLQTNGADPFDSQGLFRFNNLETGQPATPANTGHAFASFLLGVTNSAQANFLRVVPANRYRYAAFFVQDDWKISRKLTLNVGLRYDLYTPRTEKFNNFSGFDPSVPNPAAGNRLGAVAFLGEGEGRDSSRTSFANTDYKNFGPRFGFAYQLGGKTVLRGGYGIYYAPGNATTGLRCSQCFIYGFNAAPAYQSTDNGITPAVRWDNGFPTDYPQPPFIRPNVQNGSNVNFMGREDGRAPYFQNSTLSVQQEFWGKTLLDVSYVGVKGTRLGTGLFSSMNQVDPRYLSLGALLTQSVTSAAAQTAGIAVPWNGFTGSVAQALRPYPQYLNIDNRSNPNGNSTYHALQMKVEKRMSNGLTLLGAYTWARTISDGDIMAGGGAGGQDFYNRRLEKALSVNDVPHVAAISYLYELPIAKGNKWMGGWTLSGIHQYQAGRPIAMQANNTLPIFNGLLRPNVVAGVERQNTSFSDPATDFWINRAAFANPAPFTFGNSPRLFSDLRAPGFRNESFGLIKRTKLTEKVSVTFRAEFFNMFNRVVFGAPNANINNAQFGRISAQANTPRQGQLALRLDF